MRIIVTGVRGQLGFDVVKELTRRGIAAVGIDISELDITDSAAVERYFSDACPDAIVHCAAFTAVDAAERDKELCERVNANGTENIAAAAAKIGAAMLYISTDYVFSGEGSDEWQTDDAPRPLSVYGLTKYRGELAVKKYLDRYFIIRTSWVFGENGGNFVKTMLRLGRERGELSIVCDQIGSPTYTGDLAKLICDMIATDRYGVYHATNEGFCSWFDFAREIFLQAGIDVKITPVTTEQYNAAAPRPKNSRLSKDSIDLAGFERLPTWQNALSRYLFNLGEHKNG